jgi:RNA polymerase sigma factor (sigma-70 family)
MDAVVRDLQTLFGPGVLGTLSDAQLLDRFLDRREGAVFEAIIRRHGPMAWGVCHRILQDYHDAEDAFQATFLVLARRAASIKPREKLGNWLYGVAYQTAMKARAQRTKRRTREAHLSELPEPMITPDHPRDELAEALERELSRLPERYRTPIVLCELEGMSHKQAARQLGWPIGTVSSRLSRARSMLAKRLSPHGAALSVSSLAVLLARDSAAAGMPPWLIDSTARAASLVAAGGAVSVGMVPAQVAALSGEVMKMMLYSKIKVIAGMVLATSALVAGGSSLAYRAWGSELTSQIKPRRAQRSDQPSSDTTDARAAEARRRQPPPNLPADDDFELRPPTSQKSGDDVPPPVPVETKTELEPLPTLDQDQRPADPLADLIVAGDHTPEELARAKAIIESMITFEKEASGKSPEELDKMIQEKAQSLDDARWEVRVIDAQLRRLKSIRAKTRDAAPSREKHKPR